MHKLFKAALLGLAACTAMAGSAGAADIIPEPPMEPPVITTPPPVYEEISTGGWYLRGDVDYHWSSVDEISYVTYGPPAGRGAFTSHELDGSWSIGGGVGYKINKYLRTDLTIDWWAKTDFTGSTAGVCGGVPCVSTDTSTMSAWLLLANAYVDLGTWGGFTPYVGAGIGGAYVKWGDLSNTVGGVTTVHGGSANWRFAYALMAGTSYCINDRLDADLGYRYSRIEDGAMFGYAPVAGPAADGGFNTHEVRAGLRYKLGGKGQPCGGQVVSYQPPEYIPPVYK